MQKPEEQIGLLRRVLCRPQESAFVVLDQFEELYDVENSKGIVGRGAIPLFLNMLQSNLGGSKVVLTSRISPFSQQNPEDTCIRTNLVSRISIPEGIALLQQRGVQFPRQRLQRAVHGWTRHLPDHQHHSDRHAPPAYSCRATSAPGRGLLTFR